MKDGRCLRAVRVEGRRGPRLAFGRLLEVDRARERVGRGRCASTTSRRSRATSTTSPGLAGPRSSTGASLRGSRPPASQPEGLLRLVRRSTSPTGSGPCCRRRVLRQHRARARGDRTSTRSTGAAARPRVPAAHDERGARDPRRQEGRVAGRAAPAGRPRLPRHRWPLLRRDRRCAPRRRAARRRASASSRWARSTGASARAPPTSANLAAREELTLEFPATRARSLGLVIAARQTLLTTFLLYQGLAYLGSKATEALAQLERPRSRQRRGEPGVLGGIDVLVPDGRGGWRRSAAPSRRARSRSTRTSCASPRRGRPVRVRLPWPRATGASTGSRWPSSGPSSSPRASRPAPSRARPPRAAPSRRARASRSSRSRATRTRSTSSCPRRWRRRSCSCRRARLPRVDPGSRGCRTRAPARAMMLHTAAGRRACSRPPTSVRRRMERLFLGEPVCVP